ncbi:methyl-accepting chemotaxis protein [Methylomagnum sp.]
MIDSGSALSDTTNIIAFLFFGLGMVTMIVAVVVFIAAGRKQSVQLDEQNRQNRQNQEAIMRLMDELAVIAEGDLTKRAEVTEDITGAIADSLNFTVEEIHTLVLRIHEAAEQLNEASQQGRQAADELRQASERQSEDVRSATASMNEMTESVAEVANSAEAIFKVAEQSLNAAEQGADAVQKTMSGMNVIRDSIQDTSKRIKRLGESSQEIGEIVDLISGIAEQTNVLALNAAIQAASAGEAGRGFAIVAEEVQRLAERSAEATKQIGALVSAIQNDAKGAVAAMEKSTEEVVEGARLSDGAGEKLVEIQKVSRKLAELIANITGAAKQQEQSATQTTRRMDDILQITNLTSEGTRETTISMQRLADLANALQLAVSGFKV